MPEAPRRITSGIDLVRIDRLRGFVDELGEAFLRRTFTPAELAFCGGDPERLAGRWAAKEAVLKALGAGVEMIGFTEVEVLREESGAPLLVLHGRAAEIAAAAGWRAWSVSISHDGAYATAVAVATS